MTNYYMIKKCTLCSKRLRPKVKCIESGKDMCKRCCQLHREGCAYHYFCWVNHA